MILSILSWFYVFSYDDQYQQCPEVPLNDKTCIISAPHFDPTAIAYLLKVNGSNAVGNATSDVILVKTLQSGTNYIFIKIFCSHVSR